SRAYTYWQSPREGGDAVDFVAVVDQVIVLLRQRGRMTYRTLQRQFQLDDDALHDLTEELLYAHPEVRTDARPPLLCTPPAAPPPPPPPRWGASGSRPPRLPPAVPRGANPYLL